MSLVISKKANYFREKNGLSSGEPINLKSLLLRLNVLTVYRQLSESFSGMCLKINDKSNFILINSNHSRGRQHFTIAHELYHLYIQPNFEIHQCQSGYFNSKNKEELNADLFASYLLMPESGIYELIPDEELNNKTINLKTVLKLEHFFSVSRSAILFRLKSLKLLNNESYELIKSLPTKLTALQYGYDISLYEAGNNNLVLGDYGEKARTLFENDKISEGHYLELMRKIGIDISTQNDEQTIN